jgi:hypothetical protein
MKSRRVDALKLKQVVNDKDREARANQRFHSTLYLPSATLVAAATLSPFPSIA